MDLQRDQTISLHDNTGPANICSVAKYVRNVLTQRPHSKEVRLLHLSRGKEWSGAFQMRDESG